MSSYNSVEKIKYTENLSDAVALDEYIVFGNERKEEKYILFRFYNNVDQKLLGMKFEVSQYDMHEHLIERSVVIYNNFLAKANSSFVPKAKLKVAYACTRISVRLIQAAFDRVMWNEGEYIDNTYKFEHYARDEKYIEENVRPKEQPPKPVKTKTERIDYTSRFTSKNITKKNIAVFPKVFYCITSILLVIAIAVAVWQFPKLTKRFTLHGYDLELIADNSVKLIGYEGENGEELIVPETIDDYRITRIGKGAFCYLSAKKISLPDSVTAIESGAFRSMQALETVSCASLSITVDTKAFDSVTSLIEFDMAGAKLNKNCFYGCKNLSKITFYSTSVEKFVNLFGEITHAATVLTFEGNYTDSDSFFEGVNRA